MLLSIRIVISGHGYQFLAGLIMPAAQEYLTDSLPGPETESHTDLAACLRRTHR